MDGADLRSLIEAARDARDRGELEPAEALLREAVALAPAELEARILLAETLAWQKEFEEADSLYRDAMRRDPSSRSARLGLGRVLLWTARYEEARSVLEVLIESDPRDLDAREARARSWYWEGDFRSAAREFQSILALDATRAEAARDLAAIWSDAPRMFRIAAAHRDDDQPFQVRRAESAVSIFSDPLTRWDFAAGTRQLVASDSSDPLPFVSVGAEIVLPRARFTISSRIEALEFADGATSLIGGARASRRFADRHELSASFDRQPLLLNREALDDHPTVDTWNLAWQTSTPEDAHAAARISRLDYFDGNRGEAADAWALLPVLRRGEALVSVGVSAAWRDTAQTRFRAIRTEATELGPFWYRYDYVGAYDPYWSPIELREIRGIVRVTAPAGDRADIRLQATAGTATDRGVSFGPTEGTTPVPLPTRAFPFARKYSPWEVSAEVDVRIWVGSRAQLGWTRSQTVFYEANEFHATLVRRF